MPGPAGGSNRVEPSRARREVGGGVLGGDPELHGVPVQTGASRAVERLSAGDPQLPRHQVDPRDLLGHRVLDLDPGVHLDEGEVARRHVERYSTVPALR